MAKQARSNIDEDKSRIEVDVKELENLGPERVSKLKKSDKPGFVWLPLKSNQIDSALVLSDSEEFRKKIRTAKDSQLVDKNIPLLEGLIEKRNEMALLLNHTSYS